MNEHRIHQLFVVGVFLKGLHALVECAGGIALYLVPISHMVRWVDLLTQDELIEDPRDFVANQLLQWAHHLSVDTTNFYAFYLLSHGLVKVLLVVALLREKLWAYPLSLTVLTGFIAYQLYRYSYTHSVGLVALTAFDIVIIMLVWHEWRYLRTHPRRPADKSRISP